MQEDNYRRQFTDALKNYVEDNRYKYAHFTDMIYVSIFKEKAKEYKRILDLKASDKVRDTFYSEILDIIAAYESGLADAIMREYERKGDILSQQETEELFRRFEKMALWKPLIQRGRVKMASRDMALRDAFHYQLSEYIQPLDKDEYQKFLGAAGDELDRLMAQKKGIIWGEYYYLMNAMKFCYEYSFIRSNPSELQRDCRYVQKDRRADFSCQEWRGRFSRYGY